MNASESNELAGAVPPKPPGDNVLDQETQRALAEARAFRDLGLYEEAEKALRAVERRGGGAAVEAQQRLIVLFLAQRRFEDVVALGTNLIARGLLAYDTIVNTMLAQNFLGRVEEARETLRLVEKCGHPLEDDAYQMACFASRLGDFREALSWLLTEFSRSPEYHARAFDDSDLLPFWDWLEQYKPTLAESHRILQTPLRNVCAAAWRPGNSYGLAADDLKQLPERQRQLFRCDLRTMWFAPYPAAVARDPAAMADFQKERCTQRERIEQCIRKVHVSATDIVLDEQPRYAAEHAAWGNHLGARYHILWALNLRPALIMEFLLHPGLSLMKGFMEELLLANHENPGFRQRMQEAAECMEQDPDRAWRLLEETPEPQRRTALFKARLASLHNAYEEYETALPLWAELRRLWPLDAIGYSGAIDGLLKLGRRDEAARLLVSAPPCYRRFAIYWRQRAEIEGGTPRHLAHGFPHFRGQPNLGAQLIPQEGMKLEDADMMERRHSTVPALPVTEESLAAHIRTLPARELTVGIVYVEDVYETMFGDGYYTYPQRAFFSLASAQRCAEWVNKKSGEQKCSWRRASAKPVEIVLGEDGELRIPSPQGVEVFNWERIKLVALFNGDDSDWRETVRHCVGEAGAVPDFEKESTTDTI